MDGFGLGEQQIGSPEKVTVVSQFLASRGMTNYVTIAENLHAVPWDILRACRVLVRRGLASEGTMNLRGYFQLNDKGGPAATNRGAGT